jgi:L-ascorbate oxidase
MKINQAATTHVLLLLLLLFLAGSNNASAKTVEYEFTVSSKLGDEYSPDCQNVKQQRRYLFLASDNNTNNTTASSSIMPGPLLEAIEGDTIRLTVNNVDKSLSTAIHFHGMHQKETPWMDGVAQTTQCPLGPMQSQTYEFIAYPAGTHYWHAHFSTMIADGLTGPLIVHPEKEEEEEEGDYDAEDRILFLQDFYIQTSQQQATGLLNYPFTWIGNPDSLLINGKGIASKCSEGGSNFEDPNACLSTCSDSSQLLLSTINVESLKTYRLRLINSAQLVMMNVAIQDHTMTIIEVEGTIVDPKTVSNIDIAPGQRVSVLITTDQPSGNYMIETTVRERNIPGLTGRAILAYSHGNGTAIDSVLSLNNMTTETLPHPLWNESEAAKELEDTLFTKNVNDHPNESVALTTAEEDIIRYIMVGTQAKRLNKNTGEEDAILWAMNNISYTKTANPLIGSAVAQSRILGWPLDATMEGTVDMPKTPPTTWNYTGPVVYSSSEEEETIDISEDSRPGPNLGSDATVVIRAEKGQVIEIVFQNARALNGVAEFHPWHMHGHSFWVVGRGEGIYDPESDIDLYNLKNPLLRDTVTLWPLGWVAVRFVANNAGVWSIHCHLTSHLVMGMAFTLITNPNEIGDPSESVKFCNSANLDPPQSNKNEFDSAASLSVTKNLWISAIAVASSLFLW